MDIMETIQTILAICGGISVIGGAVAVIHKWIAPAVKLNDRVETLERHDKRDFEAMNEIKERDSLIMETLVTMLNSQISGNNVEQLKKRETSSFPIWPRRSKENLLKVYDFTVPQLAYYEEFCNFSPQESALFDLRKKGVPLEQCAESMHCEMTTIKQVSRRVNRKIIQMTNSTRMNEWIDRVYWPMVLGKE